MTNPETIGAAIACGGAGVCILCMVLHALVDADGWDATPRQQYAVAIAGVGSAVVCAVALVSVCVLALVRVL